MEGTISVTKEQALKIEEKGGLMFYDRYGALYIIYSANLFSVVQNDSEEKEIV